MKLSTISSLFVLLSVVSMLAIAPVAFADHHPTTIEGVPGAGSDTLCDETDNCWDTGRAVSISLGTEIIFSNTDNVPHSLSSGTTAAATDYWPVQLLMAGESQTITLDSAGEYPFYCMVHPWMVGTITVGEEHGNEEMEEKGHSEMEEKGHSGMTNLADKFTTTLTSGMVHHIEGNTDDATLRVHLFDADDDGELKITLNSDYITAFDDGSYFVLVNNEEVEFSQDGNDLTIPYESGTEKIEIVGSVVVPEFGTIAMIVLAVAIVSIIVLTTKTRATLIPKL